MARASSPSDILSQDDVPNNEDEPADPERPETSGDIVSVHELDEQAARIDQVSFNDRLNSNRTTSSVYCQASDFGDELESDNEGSFLSSAGRQRTKRQAASGEVKDPATAKQHSAAIKTDAEVQAKPDIDHQHTSTGDVLSTK